ncbi:MAG: tetratricopeptide repeat protein [Acidobacteriota bacterium]
MLRLLVLALMLEPVGSHPSTRPAPPPAFSAKESDAGSADKPLFRQIREAVTSEDEATLFTLVREQPWAFREVTHQLADLAVKQGAQATAGEAFTRLVVAGHLAAIYLQETGDRSLADRLQRIMSWTGYDMRDRTKVDDLLDRLGTDSPPSIHELEKGVKVCRELQDPRGTGLAEAALGQMFQQKQQTEMASLHYQRAADAFRRGGDLRRLRDAQLARGQLLLDAGRSKAAVDPLGGAAAVSEQVREPDVQVGCLLLLAQALGDSGERERAFRILSQARKISFAADLPQLGARAIILRATLRDGNETAPASANDYEAAARLAEQAMDLGLVTEAYFRAARIRFQIGENHQAAELGEKALAAARLAGLTHRMGALLLLSAEIYADLGEWERALRRLREAEKVYGDLGEARGRAEALVQLGTTYFQAGQAEQASASLKEALAFARAQGFRDVEGRAEGGLGAVALSGGDLALAQQHYGRSAILLEAAGDQFQSLRMERIRKNISRRLEEEGS